jgi:hypothetical protein
MIAHPQRNPVAAPQVAVDARVEQRQLARTVLLLQACAHRPHVLGFERSLLPDELALIPGFAVV